MEALPLTVTDLTRRFGEQTAVDSLSFSVHAGEVLGIIGPNGAGKTTTIKTVLGLLHPDTGTISLFGGNPTSTKVRARIGYMPEHPNFGANLTGRELLEFVGALFGLSKQDRAARAQELLTLVGLPEDAAGKKVSGYSKGMLQRIGLAQALVNKPDLLFLDEPMDGLDPIGRIAMKELLLTIKASGTSVVFNSHVLSDVAAISDRVLVLHKGKTLAYDTVTKLVPKGESLETVFLKLIQRA